MSTTMTASEFFAGLALAKELGVTLVGAPAASLPAAQPASSPRRSTRTQPRKPKRAAKRAAARSSRSAGTRKRTAARSAPLSDLHAKALAALGNGATRAGQVAEALGVKRARATALLAQLKEAGKVAMTGTRGSAVYGLVGGGADPR